MVPGSIPQQSAAHDLEMAFAQHSSNRIALVCMPWAAVIGPSLAMGVLKRCAQATGFTADLHYLNLRFAQRLGLDLYERVASKSVFHTEWFFSQTLFGPGGTGEIKNDWAELSSNPRADFFAQMLRDIVEGPSEICEKIAAEVSPFIDDCIAQIDWGAYKLVGFTTTFAQSLASLLLARRIKERFPDVPIVIGGANVDSEMGVEFMSGFPWVDYIVHGEAERSFPALLNNISSRNIGERIPGISMRRDGKVIRGDLDAVPVVNLNETPAPDYSDYIRQLQLSGFRSQVEPMLFYESSRGCWWGAKHHCTFCGLNGTTMAFRKKDPDKVYAEIVELSREYRCLTLSATDNILSNDYFKNLLPQLQSLDSDISLFYEVKANLTREQLKALHAAGVNRIQPGIESFNSRLLRLMRKGVSAIQNIQLLKWCEELAVHAAYNVLFGFPGEIPEDYVNLPRLFRLLSHLRPPAFICPVLFERFSPYFFDKEQFGLQLTPRREYNYIFPESRVRLEKVAYFFHGVWEGQVAAPTDYMGPVFEAFEAWTNQRKTNDIFCYYEKGPGYVVIHDNRPRVSNGRCEPRRLRLDEPYASIYLFCDEHRSLRTIHEMLKKQCAGDLSDAALKECLERLVSLDLMFNEGDRYLSLAVRKMQRVSRQVLSHRDSDRCAIA